MATDPLQSGVFGFANGGPVADPFDFSGITTTPPTTAENLQDPYDFSGIPATPYQRPKPSVALDYAYEQPVIAPYVPPVVEGARTPDSPDNPDPTDPDNPDPTDPPPTDTSWWRDHLPGFTFDSSTGALSVAEGQDEQALLANAYQEYYEMTNLPRGELGGGNYIDRVEEQDEAGDSYYTYTLRYDPDWRSNTGTTGGGTTGGGTTGGGTTGGGTTGGGTTGGGTTGGGTTGGGTTGGGTTGGGTTGGGTTGGGTTGGGTTGGGTTGGGTTGGGTTGGGTTGGGTTGGGTTGGGTTGGGTTGGGTTGGGTTGGGTTGGGTTGGGTTGGGTTAAEWMNRLPQGLRYSGGRLEIDPAYSTGDPSGRTYGWSYDESSERDVFNPQDYLASIYERMYGRRRGDIPALGGGYGISRETMEDDQSQWDQYSITGPNMAGGGMIRGPSYLSGGIGSLGSTYLR
jgi:hypothetical protein